MDKALYILMIRVLDPICIGGQSSLPIHKINKTKYEKSKARNTRDECEKITNLPRGHVRLSPYIIREMCQRKNHNQE